MDFALSEEQQFLKQTVDHLLRDQCSLDVVRADATEKQTKNPSLYDGLTQIGIPGTLISEDYGGVGLRLLDAALIAESLGGSVATVPFIGSSVLAPIAIELAGSDEQKNVWLPRFASGEITCGVALGDHVGARDNDPITSDGASVSGRSMFALDIQNADVMLVATADCELHLVERSEVELKPLYTIDKTRSVGELVFEKSSSEPLSSTSDPSGTLAKVIDAGRVVVAADTLGAGQTMLDKAVAYAGERQQFNRVIGSFQAVKHMCAEMAAELEPCRSLVWYAAHAYDAIPEDARLTACHAKAHLAEVGRFVARKATEVHGGMGFTDLLGLHYWFKRIELNRQLLGTPEFVRNEAAKMQGWV
ncbi:MAG: acyl-CoA/acyl-ACP dehydrogenase [Gammaproteobacteria bacterium]|nr:acyl-CoA/acyl-ACP dehydrogenase [Gammaproteobacteria bacterium]